MKRRFTAIEAGDIDCPMTFASSRSGKCKTRRCPLFNKVAESRYDPDLEKNVDVNIYECGLNNG